jgi:hypothetical protein
MSLFMVCIAYPCCRVTDVLACVDATNSTKKRRYVDVPPA